MEPSTFSDSNRRLPELASAECNVADATHPDSLAAQCADKPSALSQAIIRPFRDGDASAFFTLNEAWISRWFVLEQEDLELLRDPQTHILGRGGHIFVAEFLNEVVGCFALLPKSGGVLRLARMAVRENLRGRGLGRLMLRHAISTARSLHAKAVVLETSSKLASAVRLYESAGFRYVSPDPHGPALPARADLFMELALNDG